jgi:multiple sugar transport system permease protein
MTIAADLQAKAPETTEHGKQEDNKRAFSWPKVPLHVLLLIGGIAMALPFAWMVLSSFKPLEEIFAQPPKLLPQLWNLQNWSTALTGADFVRGFANSAIVAVTVTVVSVVTCAMAAYAFARIKVPGINALFLVFLATLMVPQQLTIIPLYVIMGRLQLVDTLWALILPAALFNAFGVFLLRQYVRGIPLELEEAAAIDGANRVRIFLTIILPLLRTPMVALGIFVFLSQWNSFFYPLIFLNTDTNFTLPLLVNQFKGAYASDWGALMAATTLAAAPLLIIFIIAQRQIVEGIALSGSKT